MLSASSQSQKSKVHDSTYTRYLKQSNSLKQRIKWQIPAAGGGNGELLINVSQVGKGDQVLGDCGQRIEPNTQRVYSRKRESRFIQQ